MNKNNYAVIMAGGIGSRFWPMSKVSLPKQFLDILGTGTTLIQQTFRRLQKICPTENILIVTNKSYKILCQEQLADVVEKNILCEPAMRNTAPCVAYAAFRIQNENPDANMIIAASDHIITKEDEFVRVINDCLELSAANDILLTIGIKPTRPDTGYGYIQFAEEGLLNYKKVRKVKTFTEKPNQELALNFLNSGDFLWNSGMFVWSAKSITLAYRKYLYDMYTVFEEGKPFYNSEKEKEYIDRVFPGCKNISIDYGIMEKSDKVFVYPASFGWSDLGTWGSLYMHLDMDENKNAVLGDKVMLYNSSDNIVNVPKEKEVVLQGLNGYIVVESDGTLLVCKKEDEQQIKQFVADMKLKILTSKL
ncbi:MAG: mannose-1-phosphate guanylyltransferase [Flavobacteriales bacterium]|jgi:mannose-1-phosphate guanylyltransferase|nr:mannose-1-phosphate guanylyltransferase [Flavobacteriales bacterium]MBT5090690.1 mannose-1-phosphate guanylyltransferase [Flavobacteriales bacterium]MBT5749629.1 mannose-1-phosphate guanylyltransferase [Flavobacteriales bacterium]